MIRIENRFQLKQVRAECQAETKQEKCRVLICGGTGCLAGGSAKLYEHMKELAAEHENVQVEIGPEIAHIGVHKSGCHGFCEMGPLMRIEPYGYLYLKVQESDCGEIFEKTVLRGQPVERLMFRQDNKVYPSEEEIPFYAKQTRLVLKNCGHIDAERIEAAIAAGAYEGLEKALFEMTPKAVIQAITDSKLRGRGGGLCGGVRRRGFCACRAAGENGQGQQGGEKDGKDRSLFHVEFSFLMCFCFYRRIFAQLVAGNGKFF